VTPAAGSVPAAAAGGLTALGCLLAAAGWWALRPQRRREVQQRRGGVRKTGRTKLAAAAPLAAAFLCLTAASGLTPPTAAGPVGGLPGEPEALLTPDTEAAADLGAIDALLRQEKWDAALASLRAKQKHIAGRNGGLGEWLERIALAEAGLGLGEQALWHWAEANGLYRGLFDARELRAFGTAGEILAGHPRREPGQAPPGMTLEPLGPEVQSVVRTAGEMPHFAPGPWAPRQWLRLEIVVDEQGRPRDPLVLSARSDEAAYLALEALHDWRFSPATKHGQPVAVLHSVDINPPGTRPLAKIITLSSEAAAIESLLRRQQWQEAAVQAERRWYSLLDSPSAGGAQEAERAALGLTMAFRALAQAGLNANAWAICRWEAAQSLMPSLHDLDLSPYGSAGKAVAAWQKEAFNSPFRRFSSLSQLAQSPEKKEFTKPVRTGDAAQPYYPKAARRQHLTGKVILESILDTNGRICAPYVLRPAAADEEVPFAASALDAVCDWRFKPATIDGQPVKLYYTVTVNFEIRGR
jgi:TonB family protein